MDAALTIVVWVLNPSSRIDATLKTATGAGSVIFLGLLFDRGFSSYDFRGKSVEALHGGNMDYQKIAGDILFGGDVLDNAVRGEFIEALTFNALLRHDVTLGQKRWHHIGKGWGPWDLQRGTAAAGDRVRFQVKTKASKQLWTPEKPRHEYDLGHRTYKVVPKYFFRDFDQQVIGECEVHGYRADFFLLAWHESGPQSDPNTYAYFIVPASDLTPTLAGPVKKIHIDVVKTRKSHSFAELPQALNDSADAFLSVAKTPA